MISVLLTSESRYPVNRRLVKQVINDVLKEQKITSDAEVSVLIIGDRKMAQLNERHLKHQGTTDVISFPLENSCQHQLKSSYVSPPDNLLRLGDIVVSYPQAVKQAAENNILVDQEITKLIKHGVLHLLGVHHEE